MIPPSCKGYDESIGSLEFDADKAAEMLDEAGYKEVTATVTVSFRTEARWSDCDPAVQLQIHGYEKPYRRGYHEQPGQSWH